VVSGDAWTRHDESCVRQHWGVTAAMRPALLVIDLQRWFLEIGPPEKLAAVESVIARTNELIDFFHERGLPIMHIQTVHKRRSRESDAGLSRESFRDRADPYRRDQGVGFIGHRYWFVMLP